MRIDAVVFDCEDAAPLARFWAAALGWRVAPYDRDELERLADEGVHDPEDDPSVMVEPPEDEAPGLPVLFFTEVPEGKKGLGATLRNWAEDGGNVWAVMLDPEGNEFCVMPPEA